MSVGDAADVIVVGAGAAGSAAAFHLAARGRRVLLLERESLPRSKPCGGGMAASVQRWFPFDLSPAVDEVIRRVRFTTSHPRDFVKPIIDAIDNNPALCNHVHLPVQSGSSKVLAAMQRLYTREQYMERIAWMKAAKRDIAITTDIIVGFPGETDEDFDMLLDWLGEAKLDRVGAFKYEPVTGASANDLGLPQVPDEVKNIRYRRFMEKQQAISAKILSNKVGKRLQVMIDEPGPTVSKGRAKSDAPEIDGSVFVASRRPLRAGDIVSVKIERADAYDLHGITA